MFLWRMVNPLLNRLKYEKESTHTPPPLKDNVLEASCKLLVDIRTMHSETQAVIATTKFLLCGPDLCQGKFLRRAGGFFLFFVPGRSSDGDLLKIQNEICLFQIFSGSCRNPSWNLGLPREGSTTCLAVLTWDGGVGLGGDMGALPIRLSIATRPSL